MIYGESYNLYSVRESDETLCSNLRLDFVKQSHFAIYIQPFSFLCETVHVLHLKVALQFS